MPIIDNPDFRALPNELAGLFDAAGRTSFYSHIRWYEIYARNIAEHGGRARIYVDSDCGAAMVCQITAGSRDLSSLSNAYSLEHTPLIDPRADRNHALARILREISSERPAWQTLRFGALDPLDPAYAALAAVLRSEGYLVKRFLDFGVWYETTRDLNFMQYLEQRPSVLRNTWRRKSKKLSLNPRVSWEFHDDSSRIDEAIAAYQQIYRSSWKRYEMLPNFIPALIELAAELGALRLGIVRIAGVPAAAQFWIVWGGVACIYKLAHDAQFDDLSLGTLLTMAMTERILERDRPSEINLGRGDDPYKKLWLPKRRERWGLVALNPRTLRGLGFAARALVGRATAPLRNVLSRQLDTDRPTTGRRSASVVGPVTKR